MLQRPRLSLAGSLWGVAYATLALGALLNPPTLAGALGVAAAGHGLWFVAWLLDGRTAPVAAKADGPGVVSATLGAFGSIEALGLFAASSGDHGDLAGWFGYALAFAAAGILSGRR